MTQDEIIRMAREAGDIWEDTLPQDQAFLIRFAALVAAAEREACAKMCEDWPSDEEYVYSIGVAIRARGEE